MKITGGDNAAGAAGSMFVLTQCGDKGAGLVATTNIPPGTLLISEPAIMRVTLINGDLSSGASKDVSRQFSGMSQEDRRIIMGLANNYEDYPNEVLAIFKTNAMTIGPSEAALYPWVCRANHSCHPNCNYYHNIDLGVQQLYCVTNIREGEELTVSYLPDNMIATRQERQRFLKKNHNFVCQCSVCNLEGEKLKEDETLKVNAARRADKINELAERIKPTVGTSEVKTNYKYFCLNLLAQLETMKVPLPTIYLVKSCIFSIYVMLGDKDTAVIWCHDLYRMSLILSGSESEETISWKNTYDWIDGYFDNISMLEEALQSWSLKI